MSDFEFMEKYGEDESIYLSDSELEEQQELIELNDKLSVIRKCIEELKNTDLENTEEIKEKIEMLKEVLEEI